jgi:hypothetical protein
MKNTTILLFSCILLAVSNLKAQQLAVNDKAISVDDLPEYIVIYCDNVTSGMDRSLNATINIRNAVNPKPLRDLQEILDSNKYLRIGNQTDLLNAMAKLGFEYLNAFLVNPSATAVFSRSGFVFRKKEKYRKEQ